MNFLREHVGPLIAGGGFGLGGTFIVLFQGMIRDAWNDYRAQRRAALARPVAPSTNGAANADRMGSEIMHSLLAMMSTEMADRKNSEERNWTILRELLETVKVLASNIGTLQQQASSQTTLMQVIAARGGR
jgi:hypothetical protein